MLLSRFELDEPGTLAAACGLLARHGEDATVYAGGTELLLAMKHRMLRYTRLVNIKRIPGLDAIVRRDGTLVIGALATHHAIERSAEVRAAVPVLAQVARDVGNVRVRVAGTLGGNLCFAEPHADPPTVLAALGAEVRLTGPGGARVVAADDFVLGAYDTARTPDEILTAVAVPIPGPATAVAYRRLAFHERPTVAVAALLERGPGDRLARVRIVVGAVGPRPQRAPSVESTLTGLGAVEALAALPAAACRAAEQVAIIPDAHGSEDYKRHLVAVHIERAVHAALESGGSPR